MFNLCWQPTSSRHLFPVCAPAGVYPYASERFGVRGTFVDKEPLLFKNVTPRAPPRSVARPMCDVHVQSTVVHNARRRKRQQQLLERTKAPKDDTAGKGWYNMEQAEMTPELKRDLQVQLGCSHHPARVVVGCLLLLLLWSLLSLLMEHYRLALYISPDQLYGTLQRLGTALTILP